MNKRSWTFFVFLVSLIVSCNLKKERVLNWEMQQLLDSIAKVQFYQSGNIYANNVRMNYYDSLLKAFPFDKDKYTFYIGIELLHKGDSKEAIKIFESLLKKKQSTGMLPALADYEEEWLEDYLALAYLRLGEQDNCIDNHSAASCLVPLEKAGFHQFKNGSEQAIVLLNDILAKNPKDYNSIWLLNIANMTLGKYPEGVPQKWRIPSEAFNSEYPFKNFPEIALQVGLGTNSLAGGCIVDDFNNDHCLDVITSEWSPSGGLRYFQNNKAGKFIDVSQKSGINELKGGTNLTQADYDNDGWIDFFVMRGGWLYDFGNHPNSLLRNNGDGTFSDVTIEAGLLSFHPSQTAVWRDFNNDGWLDLFVGNESFGEGAAFHPCELFINKQDGTFEEVAPEAAIQVSINSVVGSNFVKGVTAADYDKDGLEDIFISLFNNDRTNLLFKNTGIDSGGIPHFENVTLEAGLTDKFASFPTWFWDYNQDGWQDIFVAGYDRKLIFGSISGEIAKEYLGIPSDAEKARLYKNNGNGTFTEVAAELGIAKIIYAMGANYGDLDNDGFPDFYAGTGEVNLNSIIPNRMFRNHMGTQFQDVTSAGGFGHIQKGHGISFADLDNDGDQDIFAVMGGAYEGDIFQNALFSNPYHAERSWVTLMLEGTKSNRSAIGTQLKVVVSLPNGKKEVFIEVNTGGSFGCNPLRQHIGLGNASIIDTLEIRWPNNPTPQVITQLKVNKFYKIKEGNLMPITLNLMPIHFSEKGVVHQHN